MIYRLFETCSFRELKLGELLKSVPNTLSSLAEPKDWFNLYLIISKLNNYKVLATKGGVVVTS